MISKFTLLYAGSSQQATKCVMDQLLVRQLSNSLPRAQHVVLEHFETKEETREDPEWVNAKDYKQIPGPSSFRMLRDQLPGGLLHKTNMHILERHYRERYGDIFRINGILGKPDTVFTFNPTDFETVYRNETIWPVRVGLDSLGHYRLKKRPDVFQGVAGLVTSQGRAWGDIRNKVNPVMMKVQNIRQNLPAVDNIAQDFLDRLDSKLDHNTGKLTTDFTEEIKMWAFESVAVVALNTRLGLLARDKPDANVLKIVDGMNTFFDKANTYDVSPSFWKYVETPGFKELMKAYDDVTDATKFYIEKAMEKFKNEQNDEARSVLEKLYRINKNVAVVMAIDMLMAGLDTTSATVISVLHFLGQNPEKQEELRKELFKLLPDPKMPLTEENTKNMPYLRACIKESLRLKPIANGNFRLAGRDIVLSGYKVPKGVGIYMATMSLSNSDEYFERSAEFLPERWIKAAKATCPVSQKHNPFVYLPFGFGPRTCIGKRLAELEMETLLVRLIRNYRVTWVGEKPLEYVNDLILRPAGEMKFKFEKL
ncbi:probable cytochrome P450 12b2, mitochondrial [Bactrocera neohumeralis]|uniref:probable cytochrome P450 12b2, mitochondrial n=1 Tax=Bactrocera neohumeralis TaxID=98809 RepID=UPI00216641D0|nr:probable cytochrome P450 12b2, mitochondrial [Bactrocera neohumeralis]